MSSLVFTAFRDVFGVPGTFLEFVECIEAFGVCTYGPFLGEPLMTTGELLPEVEVEAKTSSRLELHDFWNDEADLVE